MFDLHLIPLPAGSLYITHLKSILYIDGCMLPFYTCKDGHCTHWARGICCVCLWTGLESCTARASPGNGSNGNLSAWIEPPAGPGWKVGTEMQSWIWTPLTLTGLLIGTTPVVQVAVELPALTTLLISPVCGSLLLETRETEWDILLSDHPKRGSLHCWQQQSPTSITNAPKGAPKVEKAHLENHLLYFLAKGWKRTQCLQQGNHNILGFQDFSSLKGSKACWHCCCFWS